MGVFWEFSIQYLSWQQQSRISQKQKEIEISAILIKCDLPQVNTSVDFSMVNKNFLALDQFIPYYLTKIP